MSRDQILRDIRRAAPADSPLPPLFAGGIRYVDPLQQFLETLQAVGGRGVAVAGAERLRAEVQRAAEETGAMRICSAVTHAVAGNIDLAGIRDPHDLANIDLAILPGELAVAENAAVWIRGDAAPQRTAYYLSQHVVLVVPADRLVHNMHEAYEWLAAHARLGGTVPAAPQFGAFISGPSKTADIEQALVIGAHGARSLTVLLTSL